MRSLSLHESERKVCATKYHVFLSLSYKLAGWQITSGGATSGGRGGLVRGHLIRYHNGTSPSPRPTWTHLKLLQAQGGEPKIAAAGLLLFIVACHTQLPPTKIVVSENSSIITKSLLPINSIDFIQSPSAVLRCVPALVEVSARTRKLTATFGWLLCLLLLLAIVQLLATLDTDPNLPLSCPPLLR